VGTFAVQIAKAFGAEVTGVCSAANADLVRSLGADHVIDYARQDPTSQGQRYDLIFELAGTRSPRGYLRALTPKGTLVLSSGAGRGVFGPVSRILKGKLLSPFVSQRIAILSTTHNTDDLAAIGALIEAGQIRPVIDRSYALREAPAAIRYVEVGHTRGKTVITV
jgi:NADPH:quinone reductase-like Zn-dependent oxidoreductase